VQEPALAALAFLEELEKLALAIAAMSEANDWFVVRMNLWRWLREGRGKWREGREGGCMKQVYPFSHH
jgi:hypothetical protein